MTRHGIRRWSSGIVCGLAIALSHDVAAQTSSTGQASAAPEIVLSFDRPEAWAMKYFTSATFLSGLNTPDEARPGSVAVGFEGVWLPSLSEAQQRVGVNGRTLQDLNKAPVFLRPRVTVGLPGRLAVIAAVVPPIRSFDITPRLAALGLEWTMIDRPSWSLGWRAHGQIGTVTGAITCPPGVVAFTPGSANNTAGCEAESSDVTTLRYGGVEVQAAHRISEKLSPHVAVGVTLIDSVFQTSALTFGHLDRTRLFAHGVTFSASAGIGYAIADRFAIAADAFYTPLTVRRTPTSAQSTDPLLNARVLVSYRIRR
jgi:hypothetical protein